MANAACWKVVQICSIRIRYSSQWSHYINIISQAPWSNTCTIMNNSKTKLIFSMQSLILNKKLNLWANSWAAFWIWLKPAYSIIEYFWGPQTPPTNCVKPIADLRIDGSKPCDPESELQISKLKIDKKKNNLYIINSYVFVYFITATA